MWFKRKSEEAAPAPPSADKKPLSTSEYEELFKHIVSIKSAVTILENAIKTHESNLDNLRGKFNAKLHGLGEKEKLQSDQEKEKLIEEVKKIETVNNTEFIPFG